MEAVDQDTQKLLRLVFTLCELHGQSSERICNMLADMLNREDIGYMLDALIGLPEGFGGLAEAHVIATYLSWMCLGEQSVFMK